MSGYFNTTPFGWGGFGTIPPEQPDKRINVKYPFEMDNDKKTFFDQVKGTCNEQFILRAEGGRRQI